jgi:hypothetical protein
MIATFLGALVAGLPGVAFRLVAASVWLSILAVLLLPSGAGLIF